MIKPSPDLDGFRILHRSRRGQDGDLDVALRQLVRRERREPRVFEGGTKSEPGHHPGQVPLGRERADAAAQLAAPAKRHEKRTSLPEGFRPV
jgi:hypothetical protein